MNFAKTYSWIYHNSPQKLLRYIGKFEPFHFLTNFLYRGGLNYYSQLKKFKEMEMWSREQFEEYQLQKLQRLVIHAYNNVPYYRKLFRSEKINPHKIRSFEDFQDIPVLTKDKIRKNYHDLIAKNFRKPYKAESTGGNTGRPITILYGKNFQSVVQALKDHHRAFAGYGAFSKRICPGGMGPLYRPNQNFSYAPITNQLFFPMKDRVDECVDIWVRLIRKYKPKYIEGHASGIYLLAKSFQERDLSFDFSSVMQVGETLSDKQKKVIEYVFNCKVFDFYISVECSLAGMRFPDHNEFHLCDYFSFAEVLKRGIPAKPDQEGNLIGTALDNFYFPLIRYDMRDLGVLSKESKCSCGRESTLLKTITGRTDDFIILQSRKKVPSCLFYDITSNCSFAKVREIQYVQEDIKNMTIKVVKGKEFSKSELRKIIYSINKLTDFSFKINVEFVDSIPKIGPRNKLKQVISKCKNI